MSTQHEHSLASSSPRIEDQFLPSVQWPSDEPGVPWPSVSSKYPTATLSGDTKADAPIMKTMSDVWTNLSFPASVPSPFSVRQSGYLATKKKAPSPPPAYECIGGKILAFQSKLTHVTSKINFLRDLVFAHPDRQFFITNRILPNVSGVGGYCSVVFVYCKILREGNDISFDKLHQDFVEGDKK